MKINRFTKLKKIAAFTLVELITVLGIITILTLIAVPSTISMLRSNRIESANTSAYEFYTAVQNYLTDQQIKGHHLYNTSKWRGEFPVVQSSLFGTNSDKIILVAKGISDTAYQTGNPAGTPIDTADAEAADKEIEVIRGIRRYLGSAYKENDQVFWAAQIDVNTYTVDWVLYSDQKTSEAEVTEIAEQYGYSGNSKKLYQEVFSISDHTNSYESQEYDAEKGAIHYVGQYPVPYTMY